MLLKIGIVPRPKSRQNTFPNGDKEKSTDESPKPEMGERAESDLDELRPIGDKGKLGGHWSGVKSHMSSDDRRRRVSSIFGEATQLLQKQERLLRMSVNQTVEKCIMPRNPNSRCRSTKHFHFPNDY